MAKKGKGEKDPKQKKGETKAEKQPKKGKKG